MLQKILPFPNAEPAIVALASAMAAGYGAHATDFPSSGGVGLSAYGAPKNSQADAIGVARVARVGAGNGL